MCCFLDFLQFFVCNVDCISNIPIFEVSHMLLHFIKVLAYILK